MCALLSGGGYAEKVAVPAGQVLPIPPGISLKDAASFPEVACTVWSTIFMSSRLSSGEILLVTFLLECCIYIFFFTLQMLFFELQAFVVIIIALCAPLTLTKI